ncbi:hypothetical protein TWF481_011559 [Arthrobotrys musiformis]|uniref:F-box domain-containing protein n=1 Tax=Arthrobotrys musiformis TaxID=47236 RepID=A0AAV9VYW5_9PEZI
MILSDHARIPPSEGTWPEIFDKTEGGYKILESEVFKNNATPADSFCYPMHRDCVGLLLEVVACCGVDEFPPEVFAFVFLLFAELPYDSWRVYWPGEYGGMGEYQRVVLKGGGVPPRLEYVEARAVEASVLRGMVEEEMEVLKSEAAAGGGDGEEIPSTIPDLIPLPIELVQQVLEYLEWSDILNLQKISFGKVIDIPDIIWREWCMFEGEFGFLGYKEEDTPITSWYQTCVVGDRLLRRDIPAVGNRERIWRLCLDIFAFCTICAVENEDPLERTSEGSELIQVEDVNTLLVVQAASRVHMETADVFDGMPVQYTGSLDNIINATGMYVSYKGAGKLRFVSGFKFMPSERGVGNFNHFDNHFVSLKSKPDEALIMHVAANKFGIVAISVVGSTSSNPEPKWVGECDLTGCAITRWTIRSAGPTTIFSKIILDINLLSIRTLQILRPSFMSPLNMPAQEIFIQSHLWKPSIPILSPTTSLNHKLFYQTEQKMSTVHAILNTDGPPHSEYNPVECIQFDSAVTRLSVWSTGKYNDICAIEVYTKEKGTVPHVAGTPMGAATDFFVDGEGGEYISAANITIIEISGRIIGLSISTSYNRKFKVSFQNRFRKTGPTCVIDLCPNKSDKVTGFYCRFSQRWTETTLLDIGVITTKHDAPPVQSQELEPNPANPQLDPPPENTALEQGAPRERWRFTSLVSLKGCTKITAYFQVDPPFRLSGICVFHAGGEPALSVVIGQIGHAEKMDSVEFGPDEVIKEMNVFYKTLYNGEGMVAMAVGLRIWSKRAGDEDVDSDCQRDLGGCEGRERTVLVINRNSLLRWEYTEHGDYLGLTS